MPSSDRLTKKQQNLLDELHALAELFGLDYANIREYEREARTPFLEVMKRKLVLAQVVTWYTLVDEYLNNEICRYYFGKKRTFPELWKTKRFKLFNHYILEDLYPLQKLRLVKAIRSIPKPIAKDIDSLNALRNGLAHAFFPENLRKSKPTWKGNDIYSLDGAKLFMDDMRRISDFFLGFAADVDRLGL
ncbi:MAG: hypothetical protein DMF75_14970 [Acidobacteria bacterium]|nr:MAG: hypothetical protein DMF75_14970 [Acidobacteriota bacterium]